MGTLDVGAPGRSKAWEPDAHPPAGAGPAVASPLERSGTLTATLATSFRKYLLPGFLFQSVVVAGGYGTGRELVEFFLSHGPLGGLLAMLLVTTVVWSAVAAVSFEFARVHAAYDYRAFFRRLLGRGWVLFELGYVALMLLVLAVIGAAAGEIVRETFGIPYVAGVLGVLVAVGALLLGGSSVIERALAGWSFVLYAAFLLLFAWSVGRFGPAMAAALADAPAGTRWWVGGIEYAAYNVTVVPVILFGLRHLETRREAVAAGVLAGPIAILPGLLFYLPMAAHYPEILDRPVPANFLLELLGSRSFQVGYQVVLFGTLIETGTGLIHALNERIAAVYRERRRELPRLARPLSAVLLLGGATLLARFGLIDLIARGYGTLTWYFLVVFVLPVLTVGTVAVARRDRRGTAS